MNLQSDIISNLWDSNLQTVAKTKAQYYYNYTKHFDTVEIINFFNLHSGIDRTELKKIREREAHLKRAKNELCTNSDFIFRG